MLQLPLTLSRRRFLLAAGSTLACGAFGLPRASAAPVTTLIAAPGEAPLVDAHGRTTPVWAYDGKVPGPPLRYRQGDRLKISFENRLPEDSTVHWHGLRLPNAMDGVPHLTQPPVAPGAHFSYEFDLQDAGTFWYHPHTRSSVQVGRGLYGALIVEEREPPQVDRDLVWVLDDWRLAKDRTITNDFGAHEDLSQEGRVGNTVTINGRVPDKMPVRAGERIRLRLINAANARFFGLRFDGHAPVVIALDGQPCEPHQPADGRILLGPAMRADLILDMTGSPAASFRVTDQYGKAPERHLLDLAYESRAPLRTRPLDPPTRLPANPLPKPNLARASRHKVLLEGGAKGGLAGAMAHGRMLSVSELNYDHGLYWALNGVAATGHKIAPILTFKRGEHVLLEMDNDTFYDHPMHLHGHSFRLLEQDGRPVPHDIWQDTTILKSQQRVLVAFVADNPGDWMFHCHILEHQEAGMMSVVRVV